jgi:hypothetical protein
MNPLCSRLVASKTARNAAQPANTTKLSAPLSVFCAKQAGFAVLIRPSNGSFETQ